MSDFLLANEPAVRLAFFFGVLAIVALAEAALPRRRREIPRLTRWSGNLGIVVIDTLLLRLVFPVVAVGFAVIAEQRGWGLFNLVAVPGWLAFLASLLVLDLAIYLTHVMFHAGPARWRVHRMTQSAMDSYVTP